MDTRDPTRRLATLLSLGRDEGAWRGSVDQELLAAARRHDVALLLYRALHERGAWDVQPDAVRDALTAMAREAIAVDQMRVATDRAVIATLVSAGLAPLLFKGAALAHTLYPEAWVRSRVDADLLIRQRDGAAAAASLEAAGFARVPRPTGHHVTHQFTYAKTTHGQRLEYDIHWKIADPQVFADVLAYDELASESVAIPALGAGARGVGDVHALLIACTHRVAHHYDTDSLQFLCDIDRLARRLAPPDWRRVIDLASEKKIRAVCWRGIGLAQDLLGAPVPQYVAAALQAAGDGREDSAAYLRPRLRRVDILQSDLKVLGSWHARVRLVREHLMPSPAFMFASYGTRRAALLPALYIHRLARGAVKWFRPLR
jgi:Uncharacterised nucleotidyltransferase